MELFNMKRTIDIHLQDWRNQQYRKPLLLRGARQVGKTYAARQLGAQFETFIELNMELSPDYRNLCKADLDPKRIVRDISLLVGKEIVPGKTLLFFDEVQVEPLVIQALRYFYEIMPELHIIAAGSLIDFAIEHVGIPVGRVQSLYMYPLSFIEFLQAQQEHLLVTAIMEHNNELPISDIAHKRLLKLVSTYLAIGGMPEVVHAWVATADPRVCFSLQQTLVDSYRQDFGKYATSYQIKYIDILFDSVPLQLGKKFKYSTIDGDYRKRELAPCLDLLVTAGVVHKVFHTDAHGLPLGAQSDPSEFKVLFLDVALAQRALGLELKEWFLNPEQQFVNKGEIVEAFVGQELLAYSQPTTKKQLYYWQRQERNSQAEVDYVAEIQGQIVPVEVKNSAIGALKSMHLFLEQHAQSHKGIKFSVQNYSVFQKIHAYPLYAIAPAL